MTRMGNSRLLVSLGLVLILALLAAGSAQAGLFGIFKHGKGKADSTPKEYLLVFPFDQVTVGNVPQTFGQDVASSLKGLLSDNPTYTAFLYSERLTPIKRENLKTSDSGGPFCEDRTKPHKLASLLATKFYMVGEVQEVQVDQAKKAAVVTLSADLYTIKDGESKLLKTFLVTGKSPDNTKSSEPDELRALAAGDAVSKLAADLSKSPEVEASEAPSAPKTEEAAPVN